MSSKLIEHKSPSTPPGTIKEAIILAGGLGTRLRSAVPDLPKCMAPVAGRPFIAYLVDHLRMQGIEHLVFALGYMHEVVEAFLAEEYGKMNYSIVVETEPLGTGGAVLLALTKTSSHSILVANGDTLFRVDVAALAATHFGAGAECTLSLKPMRDFSRYGVVELGNSGQVTTFKEKRSYQEGLINGGVYLLQRDPFLKNPLPRKFSFETDYLEKFVSDGRFYGVPQDAYFIDIGIPEDFQRAHHDLQRAPLVLQHIDRSWTLFLDRDGVINEERPGSYVHHAGEFIFIPGAPQAVASLSRRFGKVFVVSNQRGIGKGLMTAEDLHDIHKHMIAGVEKAGGRLDALFYCPDVNDDAFCRKPNPGMALQARFRFPSIRWERAIMVGNKQGDMLFGRAAGMYTVFISSTEEAPPLPDPHIDAVFPTLAHFAQALQS